MSMFGVSFLTPIISGVITDQMYTPSNGSHDRSWRWTFGFVAIFSGLLVPFIIFFVPEHAFDREAAMAKEEKTQPQSTPSDDSINSPRPRHSVSQIERGDWLIGHHSQGWGPFWPQLRLFTGRKSNENIFKILLSPFPLFLHPAVLWGSLTQGALIAFVVDISTVIAEIFGGPPNFFSNTKVGYFYVGPFMGGIIGFVVGTNSMYPN
jgi:MFS family permease